MKKSKLIYKEDYNEWSEMSLLFVEGTVEELVDLFASLPDDGDDEPYGRSGAPEEEAKRYHRSTNKGRGERVPVLQEQK